jgi:anthranilate/para-aminobenzoate synthase component II
MIRHDSKGLYEDIENPFSATRYHSLIIKKESLPEYLKPVSYTIKENILMGIRHKEYPVEGVQFHPESFLTSEGDKLLANFLAIQ